MIWWCPYLGLLENCIFCAQHVLLTKNLFAFPCFILYSSAKLVCNSRYLLTSYICIPLWYDENYIFFMLVLKGLVGLHRTGKLQLLWHQCLQHRLWLLWCWIVCFGNKQIILHFLDCTQVLHYRLFCWLLGLLHVF